MATNPDPARPSFTQAAKGGGAIAHINVPPEWFAIVSAISRKPYNQLMFIKPSFEGLGNNPVNFANTWGSSNAPLQHTLRGDYTYPLKARKQPYRLDFAFYYSEDKAINKVKLKDDKYLSSRVNVLMSPKPPGLSSDIPDYYTFFVFVEDKPETQQVPGSGEYDDLVATVQLFKTNPNEIPPRPPPDTNLGYPDVLDLPRPSTIDNYLKFYDTVFLIDDSGSMANDNKWTELNNALIGISGTAIDYDADGIDLYFLNSNDKFKFREEIHGVDDKPKVAAAMAKVGPSGGTPTGLRCRERIREYLDRLNAAVGTPRYSEIKPLDLICITDGVPTDDAANELGKVLTELSAEFRTKKHHPNWMGIQFVQIGNDAGAKEALEKLTELNTGSMVDTVPYAGPGSISPDKMERILLGGLHPNIRALKP